MSVFGDAAREIERVTAENYDATFSLQDKQAVFPASRVCITMSYRRYDDDTLVLTDFNVLPSKERPAKSNRSVRRKFGDLNDIAEGLWRAFRSPPNVHEWLQPDTLYQDIHDRLSAHGSQYFVHLRSTCRDGIGSLDCAVMPTAIMTVGGGPPGLLVPIRDLPPSPEDNGLRTLRTITYKVIAAVVPHLYP